MVPEKIATLPCVIISLIIGAKYFNQGLKGLNLGEITSKDSARDTHGHDQAVIDGVDVISVSIGSPDSLLLHNNSIAIAPFAAMEKGILVVCAVGNQGSNTSLYNDYAIMSGTSVACPHVAGIAALLKAKYPKWTPAAIRSAIMTTANPLDHSNNPITHNASKASNKLATCTPLDLEAGFIDRTEYMIGV
ncbi:hypothetical protein FNV43_RR09962 [Rhamnella rubrinervis]|uniref:Peptidase S8/S53 domain-containing protein n=1 Tax=Rhamnella rubrinervis TaxID=2594499 RepID=A0A8K0HC81_9ROSA|nr:hypothetical protein FNV43_RR09962 [Rhamnella rubrinervis]